MEIYIATFAGVLSSLLLAVVYLADRYEPEPIELIQNSFLIGLAGQLALIFIASSFCGGLLWSGPWLLVTVAVATLYLPFQLSGQVEADERFDGIVYSVALVGGAVCAVHLNNLPRLAAISPYREALASGAEPDLRDLLILAGSPGFMAELGRGLVVILAAVLVGAVLGTLKLRGWPWWRTAPICLVVGSCVIGIDFLADGHWLVRGLLALSAVVVAFTVKRRSIFRDRPEPRDRDVLLMGLKTVLVVLGATLIATVLLQAVVEQPSLDDGFNTDRHDFVDPRSDGLQ